MMAKRSGFGQRTKGVDGDRKPERRHREEWGI